MACTDKLALGGAQFGMDYGINNKRGRIPTSEVEEILQYGSNFGIDTIDTAHVYGDSEDAIGHAFRRLGISMNVYTKIDPSLTPEESVRGSLSKLRIDSVKGCLIHNFEHYKARPGIWAELKALKSKNLINKIGFSLYNPKELECILSEEIDFDVIQVPYSVFDRRFESYFLMLRQRNVEIQVRSVFLQGLVFRPPDDLVGRFASIRDHMTRIREIAASIGTSISTVCLCFATANQFIDRVVIGVDSIENLRENVEAVGFQETVDSQSEMLSEIAVNDENILLPFNWK